MQDNAIINCSYSVVQPCWSVGSRRGRGLSLTILAIKTSRSSPIFASSQAAQDVHFARHISEQKKVKKATRIGTQLSHSYLRFIYIPPSNTKPTSAPPCLFLVSRSPHRYPASHLGLVRLHAQCNPIATFSFLLQERGTVHLSTQTQMRVWPAPTNEKPPAVRQLGLDPAHGDKCGTEEPLRSIFTLWLVLLELHPRWKDEII